MITSLRGLIDSISKADPQSWLSFFNRYGINQKSPTLESDLRRAYGFHGKKFASDLNALLIASTQMAAFTGEDVNGVINNIFDIIGIGGNKQTPEEKKAQAEKEEQEKTKKAEKEAKRKKRITTGFIGLAIAVVVTFVIIAVVKSKPGGFCFCVDFFPPSPGLAFF